MPELPEVETVVRGLRASGVIGKRIAGLRTSWVRTLSGDHPAEFENKVKGARIADIQRRAKYIVVRLAPDGWILIHLRMTGSLSVKPSNAPRDGHERVALLFDDGSELRFRDVRKFGRWLWAADPESVLGRLGPEPLDPAFDVGQLRALLAAHARRLKPLLLDQTVIARNNRDTLFTSIYLFFATDLAFCVRKIYFWRLPPSLKRRITGHPRSSCDYTQERVRPRLACGGYRHPPAVPRQTCPKGCFYSWRRMLFRLLLVPR